VSGVYLYAVLAAAPPAAGVHGLAGEPVRALRLGDLVAAVGDVAAAPALTAETLRAHDEVVRALAAASDAILPARFGSFVSDASALAEALTAQAAALADALRLVEGCEQMTARLFSATTAAAPEEPVLAAASGTEYLEGRRRAWRRAREVPEAAPLRACLQGLVRAERVQRHDAPPLIASLYHLIARGRAADYLAAVTAAATALAPARVRATGPWAPYAFTPEALA
jgi:gas vesicle protein GvpL/GvpF